MPRLRPLRHRRFHNNYGLWCNRLQGVNKSYVVVLVVVLQIDQLIAGLQSSVNQQGLLAHKKREGRTPGDYFFFTVCEKNIFLALSKRWIRREYYVR